MQKRLKSRSKYTQAVLQIWLCISVALFLLIDGPENLAILSKIRPLMVIENALVAVSVIAVARLLFQQNQRVFGWWIGRLWRSKKQSAHNLSFAPMRTPVLRWIYGIGLLFVLPSYAKVEEEIFRNGTKGWTDALWRSLLFGLAHCLAGVPLYACFALCVAGLWFSQQYMLGGIDNSTLHHTTYNVMLVSLLLIGMLVQKIKEMKGAEEEMAE